MIKNAVDLAIMDDHGDGDSIVPPAVSRRIADAARPPKRLVIARGAAHDFLDRRPWLARLVAGWLARRLRRQH